VDIQHNTEHSHNLSQTNETAVFELWI